MTVHPTTDLNSAPSSESCPRKSARRYNTRLGFVLLLVYVALYVGFVSLNLFSPDLMARQGIGGMNVAFCYGIILVISSIVLASIYGWLCRSENAREEIGAEMDSVSVRMRHPS